jgi:hypothetical protein
MQYACLVYIDTDAMTKLSTEEGTKLTDDTIEFDHDLRRRGQLIFARPLQPPEAAVTVRVRNGRTATTDGPFVETKEFLGGFFLIEARDLNEAIRVAESSPIAPFASIEVRPFLEQTHSQTGAPRPGI